MKRGAPIGRSAPGRGAYSDPDGRKPLVQRVHVRTGPAHPNYRMRLQSETEMRSRLQRVSSLPSEPSFNNESDHRPAPEKSSRSRRARGPRALSVEVFTEIPTFSCELQDPRSVVRTLAYPRVEEHTEIEVPFFSTLERLLSVVSLRDLPAQHLFQAYIPEENLEHVFQRLGGASSLFPSLDASMLSRARLRRVSDLGSDSQSRDRFYLQLKSAKAGGVSRTELGIEIPAARFFKLLPLASAGAVEKLRYIQGGSVRSVRGKMQPAEAHFDILLSAGRKASLQAVKPRPIEHASFVFIDVELPSAQLIPLLAEPGRHSFEFLEQSTSVLDHERWIRKATATRAIARHGLEHSIFKKALRRLIERLPDSEL